MKYANFLNSPSTRKMKSQIKSSAVIAILTFMALVCDISRAQGTVLEIANPQLQDIAEVRPHQNYRAVIIYNPIICAHIGLACGFFRTHEHAHVALNHQFRPPSLYPAEREASADCWAARYGEPIEIRAAYALMMSGVSSPNWQIYGSPQQRATRLRACAESAGNWDDKSEAAEEEDEEEDTPKPPRKKKASTTPYGYVRKIEK